MIKPKFFVRAEFGTAFEFPNGVARIQVNEISRPFEAVKAGITEEQFRQIGRRVKEWKDVEIDGYPGIFVHSLPPEGQRLPQEWMLVFGSEKESVIIKAIGRPGSEKALDKVYRKSLLGARWEPERKFSPFESLPFVLAGNSIFEFANRYYATLVFTKDGMTQRASPDDPILIVTTVPQKVPEEERAGFCQRAITQNPSVEVLEVVAAGPAAADGIRGCEALARARDLQTDRPMMVYEGNLFERGRYYNFKGVAGVRFRAEYVTEFARMIRRVRRR
jgi:hypothetical protein